MNIDTRINPQGGKLAAATALAEEFVARRRATTPVGMTMLGGMKALLEQSVQEREACVTLIEGVTQAAFEADADAVSVEKEALTQDPSHRWAWEPGGDDAKVTLITCDLVPGTGMAGNAFNNWVVQATRVA